MRDEKHGVKISQALFAERFSDKIKADNGLVIIPNFTVIQLKTSTGKKIKVKAMINTGRFRSAISKKLAEESGLSDIDDYYEEEKAEYLAEKNEEINSAIDMNGEANW